MSGRGADGRRTEATGANPSPRHGSRGVRVAVLAGVVAAAVGVGVVDHVAHRPAAEKPPPLPVTSVPPAGVESSSWYCAGGPAAGGTDVTTTLDLLNTTNSPVVGTLTAYGPKGVKAVQVTVPAESQSVQSPGSLVGGNPVASTVELDGGGVLVTQSVQGSLGWSVAACSRSTSPTWFFASGDTIQGNTLAMALFNPTSTDSVVDMTFVTPSGIAQPQPFQGIVVPPGQLVTEPIDSLVQDATSVSSIVVARTGAVVAAEFQTESANGVHGLSLRLGVPGLSPAWSLPRSIDPSGGATSLTVFNPTSGTDRVEMVLRPKGQPPARLVDTIGARTAWVLDTAGHARIPYDVPFSVTVDVLKGPGVVVDRTMRAPAAAGAPQFGAVTALAIGDSAPASTVAVLPGPGTSEQPVVPGAAVQALGVTNAGDTAAVATVYLMAPGRGRVEVGRVSVPARSSAVIEVSASGARPAPLVVSADRPVSVLADLAPAAAAGVVSLAGAPAVERTG